MTEPKPKRKQFRRTISVSAKYHHLIDGIARSQGVAVSAVVENLVNAYLLKEKP